MHQNASKCMQNELCPCFGHKFIQEVDFFVVEELKTVKTINFFEKMTPKFFRLRRPFFRKSERSKRGGVQKHTLPVYPIPFDNVWLSRSDKSWNHVHSLFQDNPQYTYAYQVASDEQQTYIAHQESRDGADVSYFH